MPSDKCFEVCVFGCRIQLDADSLHAFDLLNSYVFPSLPRTSCGVSGSYGPPDLAIRIFHAMGRYRLSVNGRPVAAAREASGLLIEILRVIDDAVLPRLTRTRAVHAGCVAWNGKALLIPGITFSGKSSLVAELLRRGATYFSDEYAMIDTEGRVHPYPRPLLMRTGKLRQAPLLAAQYNAVVGVEPLEVGWILALEYHRDASWQIQPISQSEAVLLLLRNTPHALTAAPELTSSFQAAVSGARCYMGQRGEAVECVEKILELISTPSIPTAPFYAQDYPLAAAL